MIQYHTSVGPLNAKIKYEPVCWERSAWAVAFVSLFMADTDLAALSTHTSTRARLSLIRCSDRDSCGLPEPLEESLVRAEPVGTREAQLLWQDRPRVFLVVKKWHDAAARDGAVEVGDYLVRSYGVHVVVLADDGDEYRMPQRFPRIAVGGDGPLTKPPVDIVVCVGGDGTVLHVSSLFPHSMPPVIAIAFGSLGFQTAHSLASFQELVTRIMGTSTHKVDSGPSEHEAASITESTSAFSSAAISLSIRMRLHVDLFRAGSNPTRDPPESTFIVLNELLLERGPSPYMASLNAFVDDELLTTVLADGLIIATQTGSTAYSLSAGGSILSPNTASILFTPICPHTLSFRPLLFPDSAVVRLEVSAGARASARCSFDGRSSRELCVGDFVVVRSSPWPLPLLCRGTATSDWIRSLKSKLLWNVREPQKGFYSARKTDLDSSELPC
jgi:NAD+ kinase